MRKILSEFGRRMRALRLAAGWRQDDLVDRLGGLFARSTLANVESGREVPSARLWDTIEQRLPEWIDELQPHLVKRALPARSSVGGSARPLLGVPFVVELLRLIYVFRESRSPEEIIEVRRVRATTSPADGYGLKLSHTGHAGFRVDEEVLWGGDLVDAARHDASGKTVYLRRLAFGRKLRRGQSHEFALRSWVNRDPEPSTEIQVEMTIPCEVIAIDVHFLGRDVPASWRFGPIADETLVPDDHDDQSWALSCDSRRASAVFEASQPGAIHGLQWQW